MTFHNVFPELRRAVLGESVVLRRLQTWVPGMDFDEKSFRDVADSLLQGIVTLFAAALSPQD